ncbi:NhaP-type Na+/H+ or K+/H+ antiporter [Daejeonella rubra]|uniref:NhaP-type Na+/H+ or K+/H+ antiporter n=1 Tax=Daejeonella rubra TaxID=990371 RepID=A0A1G9X6T7_9SPHI|nr:cation:proton antiporter [Daejeonella rubra]SDM92470.1 NhaP-type Na+/H+ or K+/H+ antiporter [Daejeonella rubra]
MIFDTYYILIVLCILVIMSYLFNIISDRLKVPSVILLISCGILFKIIGDYFQFVFPVSRTVLELLGVVGLILIVLEGSLDLKITPDKRQLIKRSLLAAILMLFSTTIAIAFILGFTLDMSFKQALPYAVAMGVISSAIAIPSVNKLEPNKKDFIIYESSFSDIIGIMLFNYVISNELLSIMTVGTFLGNLVLICVISIICTLFVLLLFKYLKGHIKVFLILSILILVYSLSKQLHLPSLFFILVFGLVLNNVEPYLRGWLKDYLHPEKLLEVNIELKTMTAELAFLIRTFFFLLFGYSIDISLIVLKPVVLTGTLVILVILLLRYVFLRFISKTNIFPELFIAPRGLITIILFYSIPIHLATDKFNEGVLSFVILGSGLIMMLGLIFTNKKFNVENELAPEKFDNGDTNRE